MVGMKVLRTFVVAVIVLTGLTVTAFMMREGIAGWLLKSRLADELSRRLGADVELEGIRYHNGMLAVERFRASGGAMPFASLEITGASVSVDWSRLRNWAGSPLAIEADAIDLVLHNEPPTRMAGRASGGGANAAEMPDLDFLVGKFSLRHEDPALWQIRDTAVRAGLSSGEWTFSARGGTLFAQGWPELSIERLSGTQRSGGWNFTSFALNRGKGGALGGSAVLREGQWSGEFSWQDMALRGLLPAGAEPHFSGRSSGDARLSGGVLSGQMKIEEAEARKLPALVKLASIFTREDYDTVPWQSLRFKFRRGADGELGFEDLNAVSPKGIVVQGTGRISGDTIKAELQLGVQREGRPWLVAFVPVLFRVEKHGYLWTPVRVGGSLQSPTEDLSPRVVAALASVPVSKAVEGAVEVPAGAIEAAGGLLRGLLGP